MLTISNQIRDLSPLSWYSFRPIDVNVEFDNSKPYGVNAEASYVVNAVNGDYMIPRWNRPMVNFENVDTNILSNQLAESEFLVENDGSIMVGRNNSRMAGLNAYEHIEEDAVEKLDDVLAKIDNGTYHEYLFQVRGSSNSFMSNYMTFEYAHDSDDCYLPVMFDTKKNNESFPITAKYQNKVGDLEVWSITKNPIFIENDGFGNIQDTRDIVFKLINPNTGNSIGKTFTYEFVRTGSLVPGVNSSVVDWIVDPGRMYTQPEYDPDLTKPRDVGIVNVFIRKSGRISKMLTNDNMKLAIPSWDEIYVLVKTPKLNDKGRSYDMDETTTGSVDTSGCIMNMWGLKFYYNSMGRSISIYDTELNQSVNTVTFSAPADQTILTYVKVTYEKLANHNPSIGRFHYNTIFEFRFPGTGDNKYFHKRLYDGGLKDFSYKGQYPVTSIRSIDSYPFMIGHMPEIDVTISTKRKINCKFSPAGSVYEIEVPAKIPYKSTSVICAFDNYCKFVNQDIITQLNKVYEAQNNNDNTGPARALLQYWPCDSLRPENVRSIPNTKNNGNSSIYYDLYGYMNLNGTGKVQIEKVPTHNTVKSSLYFDGNITGNSNITRSWSNGEHYTLNFWVKTTQKTKGTLICDMDKENIITAGVYVGISEGGGLEVAINTSTSRIYNVNISDGNWHMVTIGVGYGETKYAVMFDSRVLDRFNAYAYTANKNPQSNYQVYFMGHPRGKTVKGHLSRMAFYGITLPQSEVLELYNGDIEHRIYGTILASNMPFETEVRFFNYRTGQYINSAYSSRENGRFVYRNYDGMAVHMMVVNNNRKYGLIQVLGPLHPASVPL